MCTSKFIETTEIFIYSKCQTLLQIDFVLFHFKFLICLEFCS